jgi:hypothetical protein
MPGDITRSTFNRRKNYSSVNQQQGRVQVDADWNEQVDIDAYLRETSLSDLIGRCGAPLAGGGFKVGLNGDATDLTLSAGRLYVDGILLDLGADATYALQLAGLDPALAAALKPAPQAATGTFFVFVDVWQREVTALEDPAIRETALGGPDTATRTQTFWQVKLQAVAAGSNCLSAPQAWKDAIAAPTGRLRARTHPGAPATEPCIVPANAGYTRLENQLYRVEVHRKGSLGSGATFKWSRDNATVVTAWLSPDNSDPTKLIVHDTGRDKVLGFAPGQWVEVTDDVHEIQGNPGRLARLLGVQGNVLTLDLSTGPALSMADFPVHPKVRRWDSTAEPAIAQAAGNDGYLALEGGVEVHFEAGTYRTGDYWLIPARAFIGEFSGDIEWPQESGGPAALPPHGVGHHYCKLAVVSFDAVAKKFTILSDCRNLFPAVTELTRLVELCSCDQEALPGEKLPEPIQVAVFNGQRPVPNASVSFQVTEGGGSLSTGDSPASPGVVAVAVSDANGLASCNWWLGKVYGPQRVTAVLLDAAGQPVGPLSCFSARQSVPILHRLCGDGQSTLPGGQFPVDLEVAVRVDSLRIIVAGRVRFRVVAGGGSLQSLPLRGDIIPFDEAATERTTLAAPPAEKIPIGPIPVDPIPILNPKLPMVIVPAGADGVARARWFSGATTPVQEVEATLLDAGDQPIGVSTCFSGTLSTAAGVSYDPAACRVLQDAGAITVQKAVDELCKRLPVDPPVFHVESIQLAASAALPVSPQVPAIPAAPLLNDTTVGIDRLANGLDVLCTSPVASGSVQGKPTCFVTLHVPWQQNPGVVGFSPIVLQANLSVSGATISWRPTPSTHTWLTSSWPWEGTATVQAQLTLLGNFIWTPETGQPQAYLAGVPLGRPDPGGRTDLVTFNLPPHVPDFQPGSGVAVAASAIPGAQARAAVTLATEAPVPATTAALAVGAPAAAGPGIPSLPIDLPPLLPPTAISGLRPGIFTMWFWLRPIPRIIPFPQTTPASSLPAGGGEVLSGRQAAPAATVIAEAVAPGTEAEAPAADAEPAQPVKSKRKPRTGPRKKSK